MIRDGEVRPATEDSWLNGTIDPHGRSPATAAISWTAGPRAGGRPCSGRSRRAPIDGPPRPADSSTSRPARSGTTSVCSCPSAGADPRRRLRCPAVPSPGESGRPTYQAIDYAGAPRHFGYRCPTRSITKGTAGRWRRLGGCRSVHRDPGARPRPARFLAEAFRCLKPGGRLLLTVPFAARWHYIPHDYWRFTPSGLNRLLSRPVTARSPSSPAETRVTVACYKVMALFLPLFSPAEEPSWTAAAPGLRPADLAGGDRRWPRSDPLPEGRRGGDDCLGYTAVALRRAPRT